MAEWKPTHKHYKGDEYRLLTDKALREEDLLPLAVYQSSSGIIWVRPLDEFNEKFKPLG